LKLNTMQAIKNTKTKENSGFKVGKLCKYALFATVIFNTSLSTAAECPQALLGPVSNNPDADLQKNTNSKFMEHEMLLIREALKCPAALSATTLATSVTIGEKSKTDIFLTTTLAALQKPGTSTAEIDRRVASVYLMTMEDSGKLGYARRKMIRDCRASGPITKPGEQRFYEPAEPMNNLMTRADLKAIKLGFKFLNDDAKKSVDSKLLTPGCNAAFTSFLNRAKL
jgi:hypothetical protein